jgi:deoxycytidine triphosphate deaminase
MNSNDELKQKSPKQIEIERLRSFPTANYDAHRPHGVLLSDEIEHYCKSYKLLDPYEPKNIKAANYELRVGFKYSVGGKTYSLSKIGDAVEIPKYEVAVIEILETVNMPHFLIGRWNIRVRWAYEGLIWVGGPQVDAGYRGKISCPIWNLSNKKISLKSGDAVAVIDFVTTTPPTQESEEKRYHWDERSRFVFEDYDADKLRSALVTDVVEQIEQLKHDTKQHKGDTDEALDRSNARIDNTTSVMFTALGVLVAAIAVFATKPASDVHYWWDPTVFFLCWTTTALSLLAWVRFRSNGKWSKAARSLVGVLIIAGILFEGIYVHHQSDVAHSALQQLSDRVNALERIKTPAGAETPPSPPAK